MPPKKQQGPNKKTVEKKKEKVIEDKTFGLKNKKGKKQQQFIKHVTNQVKYGGGTSVQKREAMEQQEKAKKVDAKKQSQEMDSLFRPTQQKVSAGADPKSVLCLFFKQGLCKKGDKCKFSHDLTLEGKTEKRSMYVDSRDLEEDTIDKWDESKLKEVVQKKHGGKIKQKTDIVCKHFLQAIEKEIYGWFWECPNREKCIYRHALPPGFVFKKIGKQVLDDEEEKITIEELVEKERQQLATSGKLLTPVTLESFKAWKKRKLQEKNEKLDDSASKKKEAYIAGKTHGISGREMFEFNPDLVVGDDQEASTEALTSREARTRGERNENEEEEEEEEEKREEEGIDITDIAGYTDEPVPSLPREERCQRIEGDVAGVVGGAGVADGQITTNNEEEVPIDEDLFAAEEIDEELLDMENLELEDNVEPNPLDVTTSG